MKTKISLSGDKEDLIAVMNGYELLNEAKVSGGIEYSFILPKASVTHTMFTANSLTKRVTEKFGPRRVGATYLTNIDGKTVFVVILGTNLVVVKG